MGGLVTGCLHLQQLLQHAQSGPTKPLSKTNTLSPPAMGWWDVRNQNLINSWKYEINSWKYDGVSPGIGDSQRSGLNLQQQVGHTVCSVSS